MTANQRRPGFRLPWSSEMDETVGGTAQPVAGGTVAEASVAAGPEGPGGSGEGSPGPDRAPEASPAAVAGPAPPFAGVEPESGGSSPEFMRELVAAMRKVADEAREAGIADMRARAEEQVMRLEAAAEGRRTELHAQAERDIAAVGEWAQAEAARIRREAEERVVARRAQLDEQLAADGSRTRTEADAVRDRAAEYEKELQAYHAQLADIDDPTAFAAAAKRMPQPPVLEARSGSTPTAATPAASPDADSNPPSATDGRVPPATESATVEVHPDEEPLLTEAAAEIESGPAAAAMQPSPAEPQARQDPVTTDIVVKGLGSFGAITGFRQSLAGADGIDGVALSLGQTGEFVFRATHQPGLDVVAAIRHLEGEGAKVEPQGDGKLQVTLDRAR
jgi:hypothetical protein